MLETETTKLCSSDITKKKWCSLINGVNVTSSWRLHLEDFRKASQVGFDTARFYTARFSYPWLAKKPAFEETVEAMPQNLKLMPILFCGGLTFNEIIDYLIEHDKLDEWIEYWTQEKFLKHYVAIDVFNEPNLNLWRTPEERYAIIDHTLEKLKGCGIPLTIGWSTSVDKEVFLKYLPKNDIISYHYYNDDAEYIDMARRRFQALAQLGKPVVVSEFNAKTFDEQAQYQWQKNILELIHMYQLEGYMVHCLRENDQWEHLAPWGIFWFDWTPKKCVKLYP